VWFGPRLHGWGWSPVTAEGWAVLVIGTGGAIALASTTIKHAWWLGLAAVAVMLVVVFLKGTSPGGVDEWYEFKAVRDGNRDF
jgi:hypothetical protein